MRCPSRPREKEDPMLLYDDTAAAAVHAATDEARRLGATRYETAHVLLGLLRTADPVTQTVTADDPRLTVDAVRASLRPPPTRPGARGGGGGGAGARSRVADRAPSPRPSSVGPRASSPRSGGRW